MVLGSACRPRRTCISGRDSAVEARLSTLRLAPTNTEGKYWVEDVTRTPQDLGRS